MNFNQLFKSIAKAVKETNTKQNTNGLFQVNNTYDNTDRFIDMVVIATKDYMSNENNK